MVFSCMYIFFSLPLSLDIDNELGKCGVGHESPTHDV